MSSLFTELVHSLSGRYVATRDINPNNVALGWTVTEAILWVLMCAAWVGYHFWLRRTHAVAGKQTRPVTLFLACEAVSKSIVLVILANGLTVGSSATIGIAILQLVAFIGLEKASFFFPFRD